MHGDAEYASNAAGLAGCDPLLGVDLQAFAGVSDPAFGEAAAATDGFDSEECRLALFHGERVDAYGDGGSDDNGAANGFVPGAASEERLDGFEGRGAVGVGLAGREGVYEGDSWVGVGCRGVCNAAIEQQGKG